MNVAKAREYFSAYHEGTLDRGLREAFERALKTDAQVAAEYKAFASLMEGLGAYGAASIEPPDDLHEKISARLDKAVWEQKRTEKPTAFGWLKALGLTAVATTLIFVVATQMRPSGNVQTANVVPMGQGSGIDVRFDSGRTLLSYPGLKDRGVILRDEGGEVLQAIRVEGEEIKDKLLANASPRAKVLGVEVPGQPTVYVAIPGSTAQSVTEGSGSLKEMARAFAGFYRNPVVLAVKDPEQAVDWKLEADEMKSAQNALSILGFQSELRQSGVLWIQSN